MAKSDCLTMEGSVIELMRNSKCKVQLTNGHIIEAYFGGRLQKNNIKVFVGDSVKVEISPYDLTKGRVVWREINRG